MTDPLIVITGATAGGKSGAALVLAERVEAEIVSADSMQVYRGMDIGTAKPDAATCRRVPHHVIDLVDPWEGFSAQRFVEASTAAVADIRRRGRVPLVVGGTVLYIRALTEGLFEGPAADWPVRNRLAAEADEHGADALHRRLADVDPASAEAIHPNDLRRIVRALEVYETTGQPISRQQRQFDPPDVAARRRLIVLDRDRADLYARIDRRVDRMMADGWLEEVRRLIDHPKGMGREASQALGYRELRDHVGGRSTLEEAVTLTKQHTRQFAKRQLTWFRRFGDALWVHADVGDSASTLADRLAELLHA